jgi:hypothetical protein
MTQEYVYICVHVCVGEVEPSESIHIWFCMTYLHLYTQHKYIYIV